MRYFLVDGNSLVARNYKGKSRQVVVDTMSAIQRNRLQSQASEVIVAFDGNAARAFRQKIYPLYKANREEKDDEYRRLLRESYLHIRSRYPVVVLDEYEADDVIATVTRQLSKANHEVVIFSNDTDMYQLLGERVHCLAERSQELIRTTAMSFRAKYKIEVDQYLDYKTMVGDSTDNLPGVKDVGPATAAKLLSAHGTLDRIVENLPGMKASKWLDNFKTAAADGSIYAMREVITLRDCPLDQNRAGDARVFDVLEQPASLEDAIKNPIIKNTGVSLDDLLK